ncbi:hypothetical protein [uncultured Tenacibaculum sp.]|uniref:hypothetical protein n=1 Tax=uncultured Tenacibaculum sp. TaxID=174713 RepID=UPI00262CBD47|nr:hypothetical protein [uncultured Tenacibaculum sp.]
MMNLFDMPLCSQFVSAVLSLFFLYKKNTLFVKLITLFLVVTFFVELSGAYYRSIKKPNSFLIYQYYSLFEFIIIFFIYQNLIKDAKLFIASKIIFIVFIATWILIYFDKSFYNYAIIIGSFNVGVSVFLYLRELLLSNEIINYKKLLPFWVSVGFLVFYLASIPFFSFINYMRNRDLFPVLFSLIVLMNLIISFGLVWSSKEMKY